MGKRERAAGDFFARTVFKFDIAAYFRLAKRAVYGLAREGKRRNEGTKPHLVKEWKRQKKLSHSSISRFCYYL